MVVSMKNSVISRQAARGVSSSVSLGESVVWQSVFLMTTLQIGCRVRRKSLWRRERKMRLWSSSLSEIENKNEKIQKTIVIYLKVMWRYNFLLTLRRSSLFFRYHWRFQNKLWQLLRYHNNSHNLHSHTTEWSIWCCSWFSRSSLSTDGKHQNEAAKNWPKVQKIPRKDVDSRPFNWLVNLLFFSWIDLWSLSWCCKRSYRQQNKV